MVSVNSTGSSVEKKGIDRIVSSPAVVVVAVDVEDLLSLDTKHTVTRPVISAPILVNIRPQVSMVLCLPRKNAFGQTYLFKTMAVSKETQNRMCIAINAIASSQREQQNRTLRKQEQNPTLRG